MKAELVPYETKGLRALAAREGLRGRELRDAIHEEFPHLIEVYLLLFPPTGKILAINRQYTAIGFMAPEDALELIDRSQITSSWDGYAHSDVKGLGVWIADPSVKSSMKKKEIAEIRRGLRARTWQKKETP